MARQFESANTEYITYGTTPGTGLNGNDLVNLSLGCWFYLDTQQFQNIFSLGDDGGTHNFTIYQRGIAGSYKLRAEVVGVGGTAEADSAAGVATGAWHSAVATFTGSAPNISAVHLYLDGVVSANTGLSLSSADAVNLLRGAALACDASDRLNGRLWRLCAWNMVLSQTDVDAFHAGTTPTSIQGANLQHWCEVAGVASPEDDEITATDWTITGTTTQVADPTFSATSGAGVNRGLVNAGSLVNGSLIRTAFEKVGDLFVPDRRIYRPRLVPVGIAL